MGGCFSADEKAVRITQGGQADYGQEATSTTTTAHRAPAAAAVHPAFNDDDASARRQQQLQSVRLSKEKPTRNYAKPRWRAAQESITSRQQLEEMREAFWLTAPAYGGASEAWAALKAAAESPDLETTRLIISAAGLIVVRPDLTVVYDERGARYELPRYVLSDPEDIAALPAGAMGPAAAVAGAAGGG